MINKERPNWDSYFMSLCCVSAMRSPDTNTKHGALLVDSFNRILGIGYNGFPRGGGNIYPDSGNEKYNYMIHAELNAILNCPAAHLIKDSTAYITGLSCCKCMLVLAQSGVKKVVYGKVQSSMVDIAESEKTKLIANNHGVKLIEYNGFPTLLLKDTIEYIENNKKWEPIFE